MSEPLRAAVVGGSGFGKYHAQWLAMEGANVVAFTATSPSSMEDARKSISELTHQQPKGYTDLQKLLRDERPDVVSICTPPDSHLEPASAALASGAHVLCEKPLIFDSTSSEEMLSRSKMLADDARDHGKVLAVNLQYAAVVEPYLHLYYNEWGALEEINTYSFEMESKGNRNGPFKFEQIWIDLGPHVLSPLLARLPNAVLVEESLQTHLSENEVVMEMELRNPNGHQVKATLRTATSALGATPVRRIGFNGFGVDILSNRDEAGVFQTVLRAVNNGKEHQTEDLMRVSVRRFLSSARGEGTPLVTGEEAHRNLEVMLTVLDHLRI